MASSGSCRSTSHTPPRGRSGIRCTLAEFGQLPPAEKTDFLPDSLGGTDYGPGQVLTLPYYGLGSRNRTVTYCTLPLGEVAVRRGERVHATDGTVGQSKGWSSTPAATT